jgi:hypothetical protein
LTPWTFPDSALQSLALTSPVTVATFTTTNSFTDVVDWYRGRVGMNGSGDPAFVDFGGWFRRAGARSLGTVGNNTVGLWESQMMLSSTRDNFTVVEISKSGESPETAITIATMRRDRELPGLTASVLVPALVFPGSTRGSGGGTPWLHAYKYSTAEPLAAVARHYNQKFGAGARAKAISPLPTLTTPGTLVQLPLSGNGQTNGMNFVVPSRQGLIFIHAHSATNDSTSLTVAVVSRH